jgi:hypothetical protein
MYKKFKKMSLMQVFEYRGRDLENFVGEEEDI